jgi:predicted GIY-YIG superfamily endonuclease
LRNAISARSGKGGTGAVSDDATRPVRNHPPGYYVYVVELDDAVGPRRNPRYPSVYVGQSVVPPKDRLRQHKDGYRSSRYVRKYGKHLRPRLYRHFNPMATRDEAVAAEQELARRLRNRGYTVYGGH